MEKHFLLIFNNKKYIYIYILEIFFKIIHREPVIEKCSIRNNRSTRPIPAQFFQKQKRKTISTEISKRAYRGYAITRFKFESPFALHLERNFHFNFFQRAYCFSFQNGDKKKKRDEQMIRIGAWP